MFIVNDVTNYILGHCNPKDESYITPFATANHKFQPVSKICIIKVNHRNIQNNNICLHITSYTLYLFESKIINKVYEIHIFELKFEIISLK